jgi:hypothetical protein
MSKQLLKDSLGWGILLWFIGYVLGFVAFFIVPPAMIGWVVSPIATVITLWVLLKKVKSASMRDFAIIAVVWTVIAVALDYFLLVQLLKPADGYYKFDVYLYYVLTLLMPLAVGWWKNKKPATITTG